MWLYGVVVAVSCDGNYLKNHPPIDYLPCKIHQAENIENSVQIKPPQGAFPLPVFSS